MTFARNNSKNKIPPKSKIEGQTHRRKKVSEDFPNKYSILQILCFKTDCYLYGGERKTL